jgi:hypothetical protein
VFSSGKKPKPLKKEETRMNGNDEFINKAVTGSSFLNGGLLNPEQRDVFLMFVRRFTKLIPIVRTEIMENPRLEIPKLHVGEPITVGLVDNTEITETGEPLFNEISLDTVELASRFHITRRAIRRNVSRQRIVQQVTEAMMAQIATDLENLFINGDVNIAGGTPSGDLLNNDNGLDILTDNAHIVDHTGDFVSKQLFAQMIRRMPDAYQEDPGLRFFMPRAIQVDWTELNSQRIDAIGERAFRGNVEAPFAIPIITIPLMPSRKPVEVTVASSAQHVGGTQGPWTIVTGTNDEVIINLGAGAKTATLPAGVYNATQIAALIKATAGLETLIAEDDGFGRLYLEHPTPGAGNDMVVGAGNANATLGLTAATYVGEDAGTANDVLEGAIIWLANPMNFIWGNYDATEIFTEFEKDFARWETVVINEVDAAVEAEDKIVKAINVRRRPF